MCVVFTLGDCGGSDDCGVLCSFLDYPRVDGGVVECVWLFDGGGHVDVRCERVEFSDAVYEGMVTRWVGDVGRFCGLCRDFGAGVGFEYVRGYLVECEALADGGVLSGGGVDHFLRQAGGFRYLSGCRGVTV